MIITLAGTITCQGIIKNTHHNFQNILKIYLLKSIEVWQYKFKKQLKNKYHEMSNRIERKEDGIKKVTIYLLNDGPVVALAKDIFSEEASRRVGDTNRNIDWRITYDK